MEIDAGLGLQLRMRPVWVQPCAAVHQRRWSSAASLGQGETIPYFGFAIGWGAQAFDLAPPPDDAPL